MATSTCGTIRIVTSLPNRNAINTVTKQPICSISAKTITTSTKGLLFLSTGTRKSCRNFEIRTKSATKIMASTTTETEKLGIKIVKNPPESKLSELGVRSWPKWGCPPSKFPWTYSSKETCFLLKGKVKVYPEGSDEAVEIGAGDFVVFPKGMSCTWEVSETVDKHYQFE